MNGHKDVIRFVFLLAYSLVPLVALYLKAEYEGYQEQQQAIQYQSERDEHLARVRSRWTAAGRVIHAGPILAAYKGDVTNTKDVNFEPGAIGIVDDVVLFVRESSAGFEVTIPLDQIRWMDSESTALITGDRDRWHIHQFGLTDPDAWFQALDHVGVAHIPARTFGPCKALRLRQNIYGRWARDYTLTLYLMPDRLLVNWQTAITVDQIRAVMVFPAVIGIGFGRPALLRIEYEDTGGTRRTVGFAMTRDEALEWGTTLADRAGVSFESAWGPKKKEKSA
jgi:hypothetical protein